MRKGPRGRKGRFGPSAKMIEGSRSGVQAVQARGNGVQATWEWGTGSTGKGGVGYRQGGSGVHVRMRMNNRNV